MLIFVTILMHKMFDKYLNSDMKHKRPWISHIVEYLL